MTRAPAAPLHFGIASLLALLTAGCASEPRDPDVPLEEIATKTATGSPVHYWVFGTKGPVVAFLGSVHGDATAGTPLLMELMAYLLVRPHLMRRRRALFVPFVNPDGARLRRRGNADGVDLARDWPEPTQPESRALKDLLEKYRPVLVVDVRQGNGRVAWAGDRAQAIARRLSSRSGGLPVRALEAQPGSLAGWVTTGLGANMIVLDLPRVADRMADWLLFERYGGALYYALGTEPG